MKRFLTIVGAVGVTAGQVAPLVVTVSPKAGVIVTGIGSIALLLGKSVLEFNQAGSQPSAE